MEPSEEQTPFTNSRAPYLVLAVVLAGQFAAAAKWLAAHPFPFGSDMLSKTLDLSRIISQGGWESVKEAIAGWTYVPPGYEVMVAYVHHFIGFSPLNFALVNLAFIGIGAFSIYAVGHRIMGPWLALVGALLFLFYPLNFFFVRVPMRDLPLGGLAALCAFALFTSHRFSETSKAVLFAAAFSLGMLIKWTFVGFVVLLVLYYFASLMVQGIKEGASPWRLGLSLRQWLNMAVTAVIIFLLLAPWYLGILDWTYLAQSTANDPTVTGGMLNYLGLFSEALSDLTPFPIYVVIFAAMFVAGIFVNNRQRALFLLVWFLSGYLIFSLIPHKESRYLMALLPAMAILSANGIDAFRIGVLKKIAAVCFVGLGVFQFVNLTYIHPMIPTDAGDLVFVKRPACIGALDRAVNEFVDTMVLNKEPEPGDDTFTWATHPFNFNSVYFGSDQVAYMLRIKGLEEKGPKFDNIGFGTVSYHTFYLRMDEIEYLLVDEALFSWPKERYDEFISAWKDFAVPGGKDEAIPMDDPGFTINIQERFSQVGELKSDCFPSVRIYRHKNP